MSVVVVETVIGPDQYVVAAELVRCLGAYQDHLTTTHHEDSGAFGRKEVRGAWFDAVMELYLIRIPFNWKYVAHARQTNRFGYCILTARDEQLLAGKDTIRIRDLV